MTRSPAEEAMAQLEVGRRVTVSKTVGETDVYLFAGTIRMMTCDATVGSRTHK